MRITVETIVRAPLASVWRAYSAPEAIVEWNAASDDWHTTRSVVDLRAGGTFNSRMEAKDGSAGFDFEGTYTKVVPMETIEYSFGDRTAAVKFSETDAGVRVAVAFDPENEFPEEMQKQGWQAILDNFKRYAEGL